MMSYRHVGRENLNNRDSLSMPIMVDCLKHQLNGCINFVSLGHFLENKQVIAPILLGNVGQGCHISRSMLLSTCEKNFTGNI